MNSKYRIKWIGTLILAGSILILALIGGDWGTSYAADAGINLVPFIDEINPIAVRAGSPYRVMIITGGNWGTDLNTRVMLTAPGFQEMLEKPLTVLPDAISQVIPAALLVEPKLYMVAVVVSIPGTVPKVPPNPDYDVVSNEVPFLVYEPQFMYLPDLYK